MDRIERFIENSSPSWHQTFTEKYRVDLKQQLGKPIAACFARSFRHVKLRSKSGEIWVLGSRWVISIFSLNNFQWRENLSIPIPPTNGSIGPLRSSGMYSLFDGKKSLQIAVVTEESGIFLFNGLSRDFTHVDFVECRSVVASAFYENYSQIWIGGSNGVMEIWGYFSGLKYEKSISFSFPIQCMSFFQNDLLISSGETVYLFDPFSLAPKFSWVCQGTSEISFLICSDLGTLWIGGSKGVLQLWDSKTLEFFDEIKFGNMLIFQSIPELTLLPHRSHGGGSGVLVRTLGSQEGMTYSAEKGLPVQGLSLIISADSILIAESFADEDLLFAFEEEGGKVWTSANP